MNTLPRMAIVISLFVATLLRMAMGQTSSPQVSDDLRTRLAQCELDRLTLERRLKDLQNHLSLVGDANALLKRAESADAQASEARKEAAAQHARADALERDKADLLREIERMRTANKPPTSPEPPRPNRPGPEGNSGWRQVEDTTIDGTVQEIKLGTIFKTSTGNLYEVTSPVIELVLELNPKVIVLTDGTEYRLIIDGVKEKLVCKRLGGAAGSTASVIESKIDAEFEGFSPDRVYKLRNGQIWQQTSATYRYRYRLAPSVTIWKEGSIYKMHVDGVDDSITVKRLN